MANNIVQLKDYNDNNIYPIAGAAAQGSITKTMLDEGVFVGAELSDPGNIAYVGTSNIQDGAVTTAKIADLNVTTTKLATGAVTSDKIDFTTLGWEALTLAVPTGSGYIISESHSRINRKLGLVYIHYNISTPNGTTGTLATGVPNPAGGESMNLNCRVSGAGSMLGLTLQCWVRASGGTIGCQQTTYAQAEGLQVSGMYPIAPSNS